MQDECWFCLPSELFKAKGEIKKCFSLPNPKKKKLCDDADISEALI